LLALRFSFLAEAFKGAALLTLKLVVFNLPS
jgi:hypothetical protein